MRTLVEGNLVALRTIIAGTHTGDYGVVPTGSRMFVRDGRDDLPDLDPEVSRLHEAASPVTLFSAAFDGTSPSP